MPKLHEIDPGNYRMCGNCSGSGTKTEQRDGRMQTRNCSSCGGSGSIKKPSGIKPDPSTSPSFHPGARTKKELKVRFEEELVKAEQLKTRLLKEILSSLRLSADMMYSADELIGSIDPLSKAAEESLEKLQLEWSRKLSRQDPLLNLLREFKHACFDAQTYYSLGF